MTTEKKEQNIARNKWSTIKLEKSSKLSKQHKCDIEQYIDIEGSFREYGPEEITESELHHLDSFNVSGSE